MFARIKNIFAASTVDPNAARGTQGERLSDNAHEIAARVSVEAWRLHGR